MLELTLPKKNQPASMKVGLKSIMPEEDTPLGKIAHYFDKIGVAVIEITEGNLKNGDQIQIKGNQTDFTQAVASMQVDHESVEEAKKGDSVGMKVDESVKEGDLVYKV